MEAKRNWFTVDQDGTVRIPADLLTRHGLTSGDEVGVVEFAGGLFIGSREQIAAWLLDQIGVQLRDQYPDQTEDDIVQKLMERGRETIRPGLLKDLYDIDAEE